nr:hypothetical protein [Tanacetum cinerariifolium]
MTSLADKAILSGADNRPPMLEKNMYDSWKSRMELYMLNRQHGQMILEAVENGPLLWPTVEENGMTRLKKYSELSTTETIQADCDNSNADARNVSDKARKEVQTVEQFQVITKFLNTLPPEWSKFVNNVKSTFLGCTSSDEQVNLSTISVVIPPTSISSTSINIPVFSIWNTVSFSSGNDPIDAINHMMSFLTAVVTSRYPVTNNQLRTSSNPRQQATINNERVTIQPIQGRQNSMTTGSSRPYTSGSSGTSGKQRVIVCYNCKGEGHMSRQCTKPKRKRDEQWFKDKSLGIETLKHTLFEHLKEKESLEQKVTLLKNDFQKEESRNIDRELALEKQTELSAEQAFWSRYSVQSEEPNLSLSTTIVEVPKELPKVSMVNSSLKKLKFHLASFDVVLKERTTTTAITEGTWGFKHTKSCFRDEIIPFVKELKELFNSFDQFLIDELTEVQNVFNQMKQAVKQHGVEKNKFQDKMKKILKDNERLLEQEISIDIVNIFVHDHVNSACKTVNAKWVRVLDMQVTLHDRRIVIIVMQVTLHYESIVMQVTLHDKRIVMKVTFHYEAIVMQVTLHDKRIVMQVTLHYEAIVMQVTLHDKRIVMQVTLHYDVIVMQVTLHDKRILMQVTLPYELASVVEFARSSRLFHGLILVLNEMRRFGKTIDNDPDGVMSV